MTKLLPFIILIFAFCVTAQETAKPDQWRGIVIEQSKPADVLEKLGAPKSDKTNQRLPILKYDEWFSVKRGDKKFRVIHYENLEGFSDVKFGFIGDRLVIIQLEPKELKASLVQKAYGVEFEILVAGFEKAADPQDYETVKGKNYPKTFPTVYFLMHKAEKNYMFVLIANNSFGTILGKSMGVQVDDMNSLPGKAEIIQMVGRSLETNQATDLLK